MSVIRTWVVIRCGLVNNKTVRSVQASKLVLQTRHLELSNTYDFLGLRIAVDVSSGPGWGAAPLGSAIASTLLNSQGFREKVDYEYVVNVYICPEESDARPQRWRVCKPLPLSGIVTCDSVRATSSWSPIMKPKPPTTGLRITSKVMMMTQLYSSRVTCTNSTHMVQQCNKNYSAREQLCINSPTLSTSLSWPHWPTTAIPIGHLSSPYNAGTERAGRPANEAGTVNTSWT